MSYKKVKNLSFYLNCVNFMKLEYRYFIDLIFLVDSSFYSVRNFHILQKKIVLVCFTDFFKVPDRMPPLNCVHAFRFALDLKPQNKMYV